MIAELCSTWLLGAFLYGALELLWRGRTHWTMLIAGGVCFTLMYLISTRTDFHLWQKWISCALAVTTVEFLTGCLVNLRLGWEVWDYSAMPANFKGQICLLYSVFWLLLSPPCVWFCGYLSERVFRGAT